ncbi:hypothetical protein ACFL2H_08740 [Planctomycetota bacterium]
MALVNNADVDSLEAMGKRLSSAVEVGTQWNGTLKNNRSPSQSSVYTIINYDPQLGAVVVAVQSLGQPWAITEGQISTTDAA